MAERIGEYSRPATFVRMWRMIVMISGGDHRATGALRDRSRRLVQRTRKAGEHP